MKEHLETIIIITVELIVAAAIAFVFCKFTS